jgi:elongation factor Ts
VGENVNIRRLVRVEGDVVGGYLHGNKIGVAVVLKGGNVELAKRHRYARSGQQP